MSRFARMVAISIVLLLIGTSATALLAPADDTSSRTGASDNQPVGGFFEGNDTFRMYHADNSNDTAFAQDEMVYLNITTDRVVDDSVGSILSVRDSQGNEIHGQDPAFTQTDSGSPGYSYEASFTLTAGNFPVDHYLVIVEIEDGSTNVFVAQDTIIVGGGAATPKYIKTYSDDNFTVEEDSFDRDDIIYIEVFTGGVSPRPQNSDIWFRDFSDTDHRRGFNQLDNNSLDETANYVRVAYDLVNDLDQGAINMDGGWWYMLVLRARDNGGNDLARDWTALVYINDWPEPTDVVADPGVVNRPAADTTTVYGRFTMVGATSVGEFQVTFDIREQDDTTVVTLVDAQTNGNGGLTVTDLGGGLYNASYVWDPPDGTTLGFYDLRMTVNHTVGGIGVSGFGQNLDELQVVDMTVHPPIISAGNTTADPDVVSRAGTATTTLSCRFTDTDDNPEDQFRVSFKVRNETGGGIVLVDKAFDGDTGEFGGHVSVQRTAAENYTASYDWDPPDTMDLGLYDLEFNVTDPTSELSQDLFDNNADELELTDGTTAPSIINVTAVPGTVDKVGAATTTLGVAFTDADMHPADEFMVSFAVRDPNGTAIDIAINVSNGGQGEFGQTVSVVTGLGGVHVATMAWDPPVDSIVGFYDLYAKVLDVTNTSSESGFGANPDELNVTTSDQTPELNEGDLTAIPDIVPRITNAFTRLEAVFTDPDNDVDPSIYRVTFKVKDVGNAETVLVNARTDGGAGEFGGTVEVRRTGNHFTARYDWNPPDNQPLGLYDLYFWVSDGNTWVEDPYDQNADELEIVDAPNPLDLITGTTFADPGTVNRNGTAFTMLVTNFTDPAIQATNVTAFLVTFRVRSPTGNNIVIAQDKRSGETAETGGTVHVQNVTGGWRATVIWDPPSDAELGTYDLFCHISDGTYEVADGFGENQEELTVIERPVHKLKDVRAEPASIFIENDNRTTILVEFNDQNQEAIANFTVTIKIKGPTGNETMLVDNKPSGGLGVAGGQMTITRAGADCTASYTWDPPVGMEPGLYDLYASVETVGGAHASSEYAANAQELELKNQPVIGVPELFGDGVLEVDDYWRFVVTYRNIEGIRPDSVGVIMILDSQTYTMLPSEATDINYTDGKDFYFMVELGEGDHTYHFEVVDLTGQSAMTADKTVTVKGSGGGGGDDDLVMDSMVLGILALLIVIVVVLVVVIMLVGKKKGGRPEPGRERPPGEEPGRTEPEEKEPPEDAPKEEPPKGGPEQPEQKPPVPEKAGAPSDELIVEPPEA